MPVCFFYSHLTFNGKIINLCFFFCFSSFFLSLDLDEAVEIAHSALFFNMGQVCNAGSRLYVQEEVSSLSLSLFFSVLYSLMHLPDLR